MVLATMQKIKLLRTDVLLKWYWVLHIVANKVAQMLAVGAVLLPPFVPFALPPSTVAPRSLSTVSVVRRPPSARLPPTSASTAALRRLLAVVQRSRVLRAIRLALLVSLPCREAGAPFPLPFCHPPFCAPLLPLYPLPWPFPPFPCGAAHPTIPLPCSCGAVHPSIRLPDHPFMEPPAGPPFHPLMD
jgi:hypothetical protein